MAVAKKDVVYVKGVRVDGNYLMSLGVPEGPHIGKLLGELFEYEILNDNIPSYVENYIQESIVKPEEELRRSRVYPEDPNKKELNINLEEKGHEENYNNTVEEIRNALKTPYTTKGQLLPDAHPAGALPVGGVVASTKLHPGFHSADICCSMYLSAGHGLTPKAVWNVYKNTTHFGPGGRKKQDFNPPDRLMYDIRQNRFTSKFSEYAESDFATQGDGNHFGTVGVSESTGDTTLVTHHGSRRFGARVFTEAMGVARKHCEKIAPTVDPRNYWLPEELQGEYWEALDLIKKWTKASHEAIHTASWCNSTQAPQLFTPHNFVFKNDDLYYHAKGATPLMRGLRSVIPMNADYPILVVLAKENGFAPHGAGRLMSRTQFKKNHAPEISPRLEFYSGFPDLSEQPEAYKPPSMVLGRLERCSVKDRIYPFKTMMAGESAYSRKNKEKRNE